MASYGNDFGPAIIAAIKANVDAKVTGILVTLLDSIKNKKLIVSGSYLAMIITETLFPFPKHQMPIPFVNQVQLIILKANDVDVFIVDCNEEPFE